MRQHRWAVLPILFLALLLGSTAWGQLDPTREGGEQIIFVGSLNFDCYPDTVQGFKTDGGYLPKRVLWGLPKPGPLGASDTGCQGTIPFHHRVPETVFIYPGSDILSGSAAYQRVNPDTVIDIVIHIHQRVEVQGKEGENEQDSLRSIVLFGQQALDAVPVINVEEIRRFQADPFFAMELVRGSELTRPGKRDFSGMTSYELEPITITVDDRGPTPSPIITPIAGAEYRGGNHGAIFQIYPNPAGNTIIVEARGLRAGPHVIELVSVNGLVELREEVGVDQGKNLVRSLDVRRVANGYYVVRIESGGGSPDERNVIATYPIIITR